MLQYAVAWGHVKLSFVFRSLLLVSIYATPAQAVEHYSKSLVIFTGHEQVPLQAEIFRGFSDEQYVLGTEDFRRFAREVYIERVDAYRNLGNVDYDLIAEEIYTKYDRLPNLIVAEGNAAQRIANRLARMSDQPIRVKAVNASQDALEGYSKAELYSISKSLETIATVLPELQTLYVIAPASRAVEVEDLWGFDYSERFDLELLDETSSAQEVVDRISEAGDNSAVFWLGRSSNLLAQEGLPIRIIKQIADLDISPVFGMQSSLHKAGGAGGFVMDAGLLGRNIARLAYDVEVDSSVPLASLQFDYLQAERWGFELDSLPTTPTLFNEPHFGLSKAEVFQLTTLAATAGLLLFGFIGMREVRTRRQRLAHQAEVERINGQFHRALTMSGMVLFEENSVSGEIHFIVRPPRGEDDKPYFGQRGLAATLPEYESKVESALARIGEAVEYPVSSQGQNQLKWIRTQVLDEYLDNNGDPIRIQVSQDLTDAYETQQSLAAAYKDAETALTRLNDTASGGRVGLFRHNLGDDTVECNDVYRDLYALPKSEFPKLTLALVDSRLDPSTRSEQTSERSAARLISEQTKHERTLLLPDGTRRHIYILAKPEYENGEVVAMIGSAFDITAERDAQEGLRQANISLSELLQKQRELFAVVGHELRTPVASIQMLIRDEDYSADEKVSAIDEITHNLLNVLEDMRIVVAPERAKESREVYASPIDVIRRAASPLTGLVREKGLRLELRLPEAEDTRFFFSDQAMRQLVTNLVKNAAIHSHGTHVRVSLDYDDISQANQTVEAVLKVADDGNGLAEGSVEKMFEAFARGASKSNGSGLGLFIAQGLATELGGILEYERSELGGACFTLRLTLTREHTEAQAQAQAHSISLNGLRILLAEDEAMLRMLSEKMLTKRGALVSGYENGKRALDAFDPAEFDLVLTDLMMPEVDGYELTTALRELGATMPIIAVTAAVIGDETDQVLQAGADGVISKPITPEKLIEALNAVNKELIRG